MLLKPRERIEAIIIKGDKIALQRYVGVNPANVSFIGGGVDNHTLEEAIRLEALEEAGIAITNIRILKHKAISDKMDLSNPNDAWMGKKYKGSLTHFCVVDFVRYDRSLYNKEGDAVEYFFVTHATAVAMFSDDSQHSIDRLTALKEYMG